jgi:hypothetical protein
MPPNARPPKLAPLLNPLTFDKHAAFHFSLAFQCIVNIGVRGSEPIRSRVVQAGTLDIFRGHFKGNYELDNRLDSDKVFVIG